MHTILAQTKDLVKKEKHFTYLILNNLKQIEERKLYCDLGYSSLHAYLERELGYSSSESALRVANIKLMKVSKIAEEKIKTGEMNLTQEGTLLLALGKSEVLDKSAKLEEAIKKMKGKPTRESEKIIKDIFEIKIPLQEKIFLSERLKEKLGKLKKIYGEKSFEEMIEIMVDEKLMEKTTPSKKVMPKKVVMKRNVPEAISTNDVRPEDVCLESKKHSDHQGYNTKLKQLAFDFGEEKESIKNVEEPKSRYIPITLRRAILIRAQKQCEYHSAHGTRCTERRNLEFEHVIPYSQGGGHTLENLKLYCRNHNQRQGILKIGHFLSMRKMKSR